MKSKKGRTGKSVLLLDTHDMKILAYLLNYQLGTMAVVSKMDMGARHVLNRLKKLSSLGLITRNYTGHKSYYWEADKDKIKIFLNKKFNYIMEYLGLNG